MAFVFNDAVRGEVPLMIGLCGGPGAGKTLSSLKLAKGIQNVRGGPIALIDTEGGRAQKYVDIVPFKTVVMRPPFNAARFDEAIDAARALNPACIIIDSMSDEHEGEGGMLDMHEAELTRMAGSDWSKRERMTQAAWIRPKGERKGLVNSLYQITTPMIFNFRAREKTKQIKNERGKMEPTNIGWQPIAPSEIVHAMDVMAVLPLKSDGVPLWRSGDVNQDFVIKHPIQFRGVLVDGEPLSERMGAALAQWARGDVIGGSAGRTSGAQTTQPGSAQDDASAIMASGRRSAASGMDALKAWWTALSPAMKRQVKPLMDSELKPTALAADDPVEDPFDDIPESAKVAAPASSAADVEKAGAAGSISEPPPAHSSPSEFLEQCRAHIAAATDADALGAWFRSEEQKQLRLQHELMADEIDDLQSAVKARVTALRRQEG